MTSLHKLRIGLIGCGAFGESHLATLAGISFAEVVAVTDTDLDRANNLASRYRVQKVAGDVEELCALEEVDAVHVVTTENQHLGPVLAALERGKHVFVEKPMATTVEDAEKMVAAARKAGRILMPGHVCRFETKYATVKEQLGAGRLGRVVAISARQNHSMALGTVYKRTHQLLVCSIHEIDIILWLVGAKVKRVRGHEVTLQGGSGPDLSWGFLEFASGALGFVQTMWLLPDKANILDDAMQVVATGGVANICMHTGLDLFLEEGVVIPDISYEPRLKNSVFGALREELSYFALCVLEGRTPEVVTAEEGVQALRATIALIESASADRELTLT